MEKQFVKFLVKALILSLSLLFVISSVSADEIHGIFFSLNRNSAWPTLEQVVQKLNLFEMPDEEPWNMDIASLSAYYDKIKPINRDLYTAAGRPPLDFSCYTSKTFPQIDDISLYFVKFVRALMLDYYYGLKKRNTSIAVKALLSSFRIDSLVKNNPYIYCALIRASNIYIMFQAFSKGVDENLLNTFSDADLANLILVIKSKKTEIKDGWRSAFEFESRIDNAILSKKLPFQKDTDLSDSDKENIIIRYKSVLRKISIGMLSDLDEPTLSEIQKESEKINTYFISPVLTPVRWLQTYNQTIHQLNQMEHAFLQEADLRRKCK